MISFIVIGRNESWRLPMALNSVVRVAAAVAPSEIIYVDSNSTDGSINAASRFSGIRIFRLTGPANAAIARNVGAQEAKGDVFFFLDGDQELLLQPGALKKYYSEDKGLAYDVISGMCTCYNYPSDTFQIPRSRSLEPPSRATLNGSCLAKIAGGGAFLITRSLWESIGGMCNKMKKSQDVDLFVRLAHKGTPVLRTWDHFVIHHTISHRHSLKNGVHRLLRGDWLYPGLLLRENISNPYQWRWFLIMQKSALVLPASLAALVITGNLACLAPYSILTALRVVLGGRWRPLVKESAWGPLLYLPLFLLRIGMDLSTLYGFFFFWPHEPAPTYVRADLEEESTAVRA